MLSLVLPTYNEAANITNLVDVLDAVLDNVPHEIIVVDDDSPDGTWNVAQHLTKTHPSLRVLRRRGRRGLSSAVVEGFDMAQGDLLAVMDADGQHDASLLLRLVAALSAGADMAIGSRYMDGGSVGDWVRDRRIISKTGTVFAHAVSRVKVTDPLGGFFALRTSLYRSIRSGLRPTGFKILLEILAHVPAKTKVVEIPLVFRMRLHGHSKLSLRVHLEFGWQVLRLFFRRWFLQAHIILNLLFAAIVVAMIVSLVPRVWHLRLLASQAVRMQVALTLRESVAKRGWILSDTEVLDVLSDHLVIRHRFHMRSSLPPERCTLFYSSPVLQCEE